MELSEPRSERVRNVVHTSLVRPFDCLQHVFASHAVTAGCPVRRVDRSFRSRASTAAGTMHGSLALAPGLFGETDFPLGRRPPRVFAAAALFCFRSLDEKETLMVSSFRRWLSSLGSARTRSRR